MMDNDQLQLLINPTVPENMVTNLQVCAIWMIVI